jgi:GT2 family glycosyltransferase
MAMTMPGTHLSPQVAIIILNWNQLALTLDCLESIEKIDYPNYQIILVDNGSTDGSVSALRVRYPRLHIIENGANMGFSEANNAGIRKALAEGADYILLLNNDTVVHPDFLTTLVAEAEADPMIGMVGSKMYFYDQPDTIWCAGNSINWSTGEVMRLQAGQVEKSDGSVSHPDFGGVIEQPRPVDFITACSLAVKRRLLEDVGLMDSRFFIYYDETDWCVRATRRGYQVVYVPASRIWHKVSAAMGAASPATDYYMTRNALLFFRKNLQGLARWRMLAVLLAQNLRTILAYSLLPKNRHLRRNRTARLLALRDALAGRWGQMGADVAAVCYPQNRGTKRDPQNRGAKRDPKR